MDENRLFAIWNRCPTLRAIVDANPFLRLELESLIAAHVDAVEPPKPSPCEEFHVDADKLKTAIHQMTQLRAWFDSPDPDYVTPKSLATVLERFLVDIN